MGHLRFVRRGVVPERKPDLAHAAAHQVAKDLLKPERVGKELVEVVSQLLDDPKFRASAVLRTNTAHERTAHRRPTCT